MVKLFQKGRIGKLTLKNRIVMAPMDLGALQAPDGRFSQRCIDYFVTRAKGGIGLIIAGINVARIITSDSKIRPQYPMDKVWLNELADALHEYGTKLCVQLSVGGGRCVPSPSPVAPSFLPCWWLPYQCLFIFTVPRSGMMQHIRPTSLRRCRPGWRKMNL